MLLFSTLRRYVSTRRAALARRRTNEIVNALPVEIQKDIGWPGFMPEVAPRLDGRGSGPDGR